MVKRNQVFVRAQTPSGRWVSADVLDLDDESYRIFTTEMLRRSEIVVSLRDEHVDGEHLTYRTRTEPTDEDA